MTNTRQKQLLEELGYWLHDCYWKYQNMPDAHKPSVQVFTDSEDNYAAVFVGRQVYWMPGHIWQTAKSFEDLKQRFLQHAARVYNKHWLTEWMQTLEFLLEL